MSKDRLMATVLKCHVGIGPKVQGEALVADDNFSARYDLDRIQGIFSRPQHALAGQSYVDKILVLNTAKGGVATAWMLYEMLINSGDSVVIDPEFGEVTILG